jgi:S-adenosylmethionine-dependent methyltransferase
MRRNSLDKAAGLCYNRPDGTDRGCAQVSRGDRAIEDWRTRFDAGAEAWVAYNRQPLGRIRCEVTWHNLACHLPAIPDPGHPPLVLDAGGGSGELALRLVQHGYRVCLLDHAPAMLDQARRAAGGLPPQARARLSLCSLAVGDALASFGPASFDVVTCHTVLEYLPDPRAIVGDLAGLLRESGLLSVSCVNRHAEALRRVSVQTDPAETPAAPAAIDGDAFCAALFDLPGTAYTSEEVAAWLTDAGLGVVACYGVRAFADYVASDCLEEPAFYDALLGLELAAASCAPYCLLARYVHLIARKPAGGASLNG